MFGIKMLQKEVKDISEGLFQLHTFIQEKEKLRYEQFKEIIQKLDSQKIELSKINSRFQDLGEKISRTQENIDKLAKYEKKMIDIDDKLLQKITSDDTILFHLNEFSNNSKAIFNYMQEVEKIMINVELIVDKCLPELTIKLPKKRKAITAAS